LGAGAEAWVCAGVEELLEGEAGGVGVFLAEVDLGEDEGKVGATGGEFESLTE
jgi:hypothetical protein